MSKLPSQNEDHGLNIVTMSSNYVQLELVMNTCTSRIHAYGYKNHVHNLISSDEKKKHIQTVFGAIQRAWFIITTMYSRTSLIRSPIGLS